MDKNQARAGPHPKMQNTSPAGHQELRLNALGIFEPMSEVSSVLLANKPSSLLTSTSVTKSIRPCSRKEGGYSGPRASRRCRGSFASAFRAPTNVAPGSD